MSALFADIYLNLRSKLSDLLKQVDQLATKTHSKVEGLQEMALQLEDPIRVLFLGDLDDNSSDFIDILSGTKLSPHLVAKDWSAIDFSSQTNHDNFPCPVKIIKHEKLDDLLIVKSKPCSQLTEQDQPQMAHWTTQSDLIFWIFTVENPWSSAIWGQIEQLPPETISRSVIVLNKIDELPEVDLQLTLQHMHSLAKQRLPINIPILPISTKEYKGFAEVWEHANSIIEHSPDRLHFLAQVYDKAQRVMEYIEELSDKRSKSLDGDQGFLRSLEADIDRQREREIQLYTGRGVNLTEDFINQIEPMLENLHAQSGILSSTLELFGRRLIASNVEKDLLKATSLSYGKRTQETCNKILLDIKEQWLQKQSHLNERLGTDTGDFQVEPFKNLLPQLQTKMERSVETAIQSMRLKVTMDAMLAPRRAKNKQLLGTVLVLYSLAGICGTLQLPPSSLPAYALLASALVLTVYYFIKVLSSRRAIISAVADRVIDLRMDFRDSIIEDYQDMVREFFTGYAPMFEEMRRKIAEAKMNLEPLQKEHHSIFLQLKVLETEITRN